MKPKEILIASLRGIVDDLARGNDKSKRMARILDSAGDLLDRSEKRFDLFWEDAAKVYADMSRIHNRMYQDLGGQLGSGEFFGVDIEEVESKTGVALDRLLEGVDPEGYMKLQVGIGQLRNLQQGMQRAVDQMPFVTPDVAILAKVERIYWLALMSVYEYSHQEKVLKILHRYDTKMS
jgi:hypothetical protein